jgi:hypothetical protein
MFLRTTQCFCMQFLVRNWFLFVRCTQRVQLMSYCVNVILIRPDVSCQKLVDGFRLNLGLLF